MNHLLWQSLEMALLQGPVFDGKLIPVLILDTDTRPDVAEMIRVHRHLGPGDGTSQWATSLDDTDRVLLLLSFQKPVELKVIIPFSIERQAILVAGALRIGAVYLQSGRAGDSVGNTLEQLRILVEVSATGFRPYWDALLFGRMTAVMSARHEISLPEAKPFAEELIAKMQELVDLRFP